MGDIPTLRLEAVGGLHIRCLFKIYVKEFKEVVIQIQLTTLDRIETKTYRDVARHNYNSYVAGFMANKPNYKAGRMYILRGRERKLVHQFGEM